MSLNSPKGQGGDIGAAPCLKKGLQELPLSTPHLGTVLVHRVAACRRGRAEVRGGHSGTGSRGRGTDRTRWGCQGLTEDVDKCHAGASTQQPRQA